MGPLAEIAPDWVHPVLGRTAAELAASGDRRGRRRASLLAASVATDTNGQFQPGVGGAMWGRGRSQPEAAMSEVQVEQQTYRDAARRRGSASRYFLTVADIQRSLEFYAKVFGGRILSRGDGKGAPGYLQIANTWLIVNVGGGADARQADGDAPRPARPRSRSAAS